MQAFVCSQANQELEALDKELESTYNRLDEQVKASHPRPSIKTIKCATVSQFVDAAYGCEWIAVAPEVARPSTE